MSQYILKSCLNIVRDEIHFLSRADESDDSDLRVVMDQKAYLEEINRNLRWGYIFAFVLSLNIERFSIERRKTKTKVITLANHQSHKHYSRPIKTHSNYM